jgi:hypothetical protein
LRIKPFGLITCPMAPSFVFDENTDYMTHKNLCSAQSLIVVAIM